MSQKSHPSLCVPLVSFIAWILPVLKMERRPSVYNHFFLFWSVLYLPETEVA